MRLLFFLVATMTTVVGCGSAPHVSHIRGDFGPAVGVNGEATVQNDKDQVMVLRHEARPFDENSSGREGILLLYLNGAELGSFKPGTYVFDYDATALDPQPVEAHVCSGAASNDISWDQPAYHTDLKVDSPVEGEIHFSVRTQSWADNLPDGVEPRQSTTTDFWLNE